MGKKIRSARGEQVDFDLLRIKEQMSSSPPPQDVKMRQDFIEKRLRRRLKKVSPPAPRVDNNRDKIEEPKLPGTETLSEEPTMIDEVETSSETKSTARTTRQKTRKPVADNNAE